MLMDTDFLGVVGMKGNKTAITGLILIFCGILLLVPQLGFLRIHLGFKTWPLIILLLGALCQYAFFALKKAPAFLVAGGMLITYGLLFLFETATNWKYSEYTWPVYQFGLGAGFLELYFFGGRKKGLLLPALILTLVPIFWFIIILKPDILHMIKWGYLLPAVLIAGGAAVIMNSIRNNKG